MNALETVKTLLSAVEKQDNVAAKALLASDFVFSGATPTPIGADEWLGVHSALHAAMKDFKFNPLDLKEVNGAVKYTVKLTGTHTGTFALPMPGFTPIPASNKKIENITEHVTATVADGKVKALNVEHIDKGGLPEIVRQMGGKL